MIVPEHHPSAGSPVASCQSVETLPLSNATHALETNILPLCQRKILSNPVLSNRIVSGFDYSGISVSMRQLQAAPARSITPAAHFITCPTAVLYAALCPDYSTPAENTRIPD